MKPLEAGAPADWVEAIIRDYQDTLTGGLYEAIYALDAPQVEQLMCAQARTCVAAFLNVSALRAPLPLEDFLTAIRTAGPSQIDIRRDGDTIMWTERHRGECVCPFVRRKVVRLAPPLCVCGAHWVRTLFDQVTHTTVDVDIVETVAHGAPDCTFRIRLTDTPS